jgi:hypothetical protein
MLIHVDMMNMSDFGDRTFRYKRYTLFWINENLEDNTFFVGGQLYQ